MIVFEAVVTARRAGQCAVLTLNPRWERFSEVIDYHAVLEPGVNCRPGDTVLLGYRTQMQMTRSYLACVSGLSKGTARFHTIFDWACTPLDGQLEPVSPAIVRSELDGLLASEPQEKLFAPTNAGSR